jgi:hypothetical protein
MAPGSLAPLSPERPRLSSIVDTTRAEPMRIEAVTVCVNYADFLKQVAPHNLPHLDRWVIVTAPEDVETRALCRACSLECITTRDFARDAEFAKSRGIERGLAHVEASDWLLHLDADVALPADFREVLRDAHLGEDAIFGCDRLNVSGFDAWKRVERRGLWSRTNQWFVPLDRPDCRRGARVCNSRHGYTPIGYFQLWHGDSFNWRGAPAKRYPLTHGTAARTDVAHALHWDRRQRLLVPELLVWHLESGPGHMGANWQGRRTPRFGPAAAIEQQCYGRTSDE